jgi:hypothetical protein
VAMRGATTRRRSIRSLVIRVDRQFAVGSFIDQKAQEWLSRLVEHGGLLQAADGAGMANRGSARDIPLGHWNSGGIF